MDFAAASHLGAASQCEAFVTFDRRLIEVGRWRLKRVGDGTRVTDKTPLALRFLSPRHGVSGFWLVNVKLTDQVKASGGQVQLLIGALDEPCGRQPPPAIVDLRQTVPVEVIAFGHVAQVVRGLRFLQLGQHLADESNVAMDYGNWDVVASALQPIKDAVVDGLCRHSSQSARSYEAN